MRVLLIHNRYQQEGGEDVAVDLQQQMLKENGHEAEILYFDNEAISGSLSKIAAGRRAFYSKQAERQVAEKIKSFRPQIVHVHNIFFDASPSVFYACKKMDVPVLLTIHNYRLICANALLLRNNKPCELCTQDIFPLSGIRYRCYRNSAIESALVTAITAVHKIAGTWKHKIDKYIFLTDFALSKIIGSSLSLPANKTVVIPNYTKDQGVGSERHNYYLYVGRISIEKGVESLLDAFSRTGNKLLIAGGGPEKERLANLYSGANNIEFLGERSKTDVIDLMKNAKALVFPSLWYEGLPYTIIEAFSTGTPVIASRLGAMEDLIVNDYNGYHFTAGNPDSLQQAIQYFERNADQRLYENARKTYLAKYTRDVHYQKLMTVYEELIRNE